MDPSGGGSSLTSLMRPHDSDVAQGRGLKAHVCVLYGT